jgi:LysR family hydrogen peroxide-inducible transcriptional activator
MPTLRQLRYFIALTKHRHFGRAAEACSVTQPALSMQIRELESSLGVDLAERRPGDVVLTDVGLEVARRGERILAAERDLVDFARHRGRLLAGRLMVGVIPTVAPYLLPKILPPVQQRFADLRIELRETRTKVLLDELASGTLDLLILALPVPEAEVETIRLFDDPFLLAVPRDDPRAPTARVTAGDVDEERLILLEEGHCLRDQAVAFCGNARHDGAMALGATSLATVMQMVASGYGVTLLPAMAAEVEARDERVKLLHFAPPRPGRTIGLAWRRTSPRKADFVALAQLISTTVGSSGRDNRTGTNSLRPSRK